MNFEAKYSWSISSRAGDGDKILKGHEENVGEVWSNVSSIHSFREEKEEEERRRKVRGEQKKKTYNNFQTCNNKHLDRRDNNISSFLYLVDL
jgi:hypothetical protein